MASEWRALHNIHASSAFTSPQGGVPILGVPERVEHKRVASSIAPRGMFAAHDGIG